MGEGIAMLLVGFLAGGVAASVVWAVIVVGKRRAAAAQKAEREQIMASVGEALAEADAIETGFRGGLMPVSAFRRGLGDKVTAIMRLLRTNMHYLDSFFVKYAEQEAREYLRMIDNPERRRPEGARSPAPIPAWVADLNADSPPETALAAVVSPPPAAAADLPRGAEPPPDDVPFGDLDQSEPRFAPAPAPEADFDAAAGEAPDVAGSRRFTAFLNEPAPATPDAGATDTSIVTAVETEEDEFDQAEPEIPYSDDSAAAAAEVAATDAVDEIFDQFESEPAAPAFGGFEPPPPAAPAFDDVSEEELVLGESPAGAFAPAFTQAPPPPPPAPPPPARGDDRWTGGDSIDEFEESAYAQFEIPAAPPPQMPPPPPPFMETPPPQSRPWVGEPDDHEFTETSSIDRSAILSAMAASGQALPSIQTPLSTQMPLMPPEQTAPVEHVEHVEHVENIEHQEEHQGITGDDVVDSIDNFFKLN